MRASQAEELPVLPPLPLLDPTSRCMTSGHALVVPAASTCKCLPFKLEHGNTVNATEEIGSLIVAYLFWQDDIVIRTITAMSRNNPLFLLGEQAEAGISSAVYAG